MPAFLSLTVFTTLLAPSNDLDAESPDSKWGHSSHGSAYDEGPRQKPWKMKGIGEIDFPVTSSHPEVQGWFNQGMALLHGFWFYEAERAFRWCAKLDPDCAMAYWGLARTTGRDEERSQKFLEQASARKEQVTPREVAFIELQESLHAWRDAKPEDKEELHEKAAVHLDKLIMDFPGDVEAKALHALVRKRLNRGMEDRSGEEAVLQGILEIQPDHVGALHYRVHNWDGKEGHYAIDSCLALTDVAPNCGHLQHMPGHVLSGIGMWHEAAIAMDSATRVEKDYMHRRRILPENNWNYLHNLDYLSYIQEQLGMFDSALFGVQQLLLAPPPSNLPEDLPPFLRNFSRNVTLRVLQKAERWQEILDGAWLEWSETPSPFDQILRSAAEARAHLGLAQLDQAEESIEQYEEAIEKMSAGPPPGLPGADNKPTAESAERFRKKMEESSEVIRLELQGLLAVARGENLPGIQMLTEAAELQEKNWANDPPRDPRFGFNVLGEALLQLGSSQLAAEAFERTLETVFHDGFALAGLVQSYHALGRNDDAAQAMAALQIVWAEADEENRWLAAARATGVEAATGELTKPFHQPMEQRRYGHHVLARLGPSAYSEFEAPALTARNAEGEEVHLADFAGTNVILIFYLGDECLHCVEQLQELEKRVEKLADMETKVLAISKDSVEKLAGYQPDFQLTLLSDPSFESARRYGSFDDFEEVELHSTVLINADGKVHWIRTGGAPFMEFDFLESVIARMNEGGVVHRLRNHKNTTVDPSDAANDSAEMPAS